jgi:hypothetical protein
MKMETPQKLDWVRERNACSLNTAFYSLKQDVQEDVRKRNEQLPAGNCYRLDFSSHETAFTVITKRTDPPKSIVFRLTDKVISVEDGDGTIIFQAGATLNDQGRCLLQIDGKEYESWQVRRKALEELFFCTFVASP